jgi:acylphosphatase
MLEARRYLIRGHVQGVGFRWFTEQAARLEGINGWVANRPDGSVEVAAEGERASLDRFEGRLRQGPPRSRIEDVRVDVDVPSGRITGFVIRS